MARTGLTNFVVWALASFFLGSVMFPSGAPMLLVAAASLAVAWLTRFWPEGLGIAAGIAALLLWYSLGVTANLLPAAAVAAGVVFVWRRGAVAPATGAVVNGTSTPGRLKVGVVLASLALFVLNFFLALALGFTCQSDTSQATPGSDLAGWCDTVRQDEASVALVFAPSALLLLVGLSAASRRRAREVLITVAAGFALTIALHIPDFVLSNAAP